MGNISASLLPSPKLFGLPKSGNTFGWLVYGYYQGDPFLIAANLPGFILSLWLNSGTSKLQYLEIRQGQNSSIAERNQILQRWDADRAPEGSQDLTDQSLRQRRRQQQTYEEEEGLISDEQLVATMQMTPQESLLLRVLVFWAAILIYTSWLYPSKSNPGTLVGILVNINLVVFFAAPLKTIQTVIEERNSISIHKETMVMNWINTSFWIGYGCARGDFVIVLPNAIGLMLGLAQGALCMLYPRRSQAEARLSLHELESDLMPDSNRSGNTPEETVPAANADLTFAAIQRKNTDADTPEVI